MGLTEELDDVVQLSLQVAQISSAYICERTWLLRKHKAYLREVSALAEVFLSVKQATTDAETPSLVYSRLDNGVLSDCRTKLALLHSNLKIWTLSLEEPFPEQELKEYVGLLRDLRAHFTGFFSHVAYVFGQVIGIMTQKLIGWEAQSQRQHTRRYHHRTKVIYLVD